jgi:hypothetical protein
MAIADDTVRSFATAIDTNELETAADFLAADFIFSGWAQKSLNKADFLSLISSLKEGIPGLSLNLHNVLESGQDTVTGTIHISGYQSSSFVISVLGTPPIPQMAKSVSLPTEEVTFHMKDNLITAFEVKHVEGGGIRGLVRQLGIDLTIVP